MSAPEDHYSNDELRAQGLIGDRVERLEQTNCDNQNLIRNLQSMNDAQVKQINSLVEQRDKAFALKEQYYQRGKVLEKILKDVLGSLIDRNKKLQGEEYD